MAEKDSILNNNQIDPGKLAVPNPATQPPNNPMIPNKIPWGANPYWPRITGYEPFYDDKSDYNTNAKSYYDYLARYNGFLTQFIDFINRLARRNIQVVSTNSIDFQKIHDWLDNGDECHSYDDIIQLLANVKISKAIISMAFHYIGSTTVPNGTKINNDGIWSPDYADALNKIGDALQKLENMINDLNDKVNRLGNRVDNLENALQKILNNLYEAGAIDSNDLNSYNFNNGRHIANGNINLFGGVADGASFIRTSNSPQQNDITSGINAK